MRNRLEERCGIYRMLVLLSVLPIIARPTTVVAADDKLMQLVPDGKKCVMSEMGGLDSDPLKFEDGKKTAWCEVRVPVARYKQLFRFCFVSGVSIVKPYDNCSISVHDKSDGFAWFEFPYADGPDHGRCEFTCLMK